MLAITEMYRNTMPWLMLDWAPHSATIRPLWNPSELFWKALNRYKPLQTVSQYCSFRTEKNLTFCQNSSKNPFSDGKILTILSHRFAMSQFRFVLWWHRFVTAVSVNLRCDTILVRHNYFTPFWVVTVLLIFLGNGPGSMGINTFRLDICSCQRLRTRTFPIFSGFESNHFWPKTDNNLEV